MEITFHFAGGAKLHNKIDLFSLTHCGLMMPYGITDVWSTLVQVMGCCMMVLSHYLNQWWLVPRWTMKTHLKKILHKLKKKAFKVVFVERWPFYWENVFENISFKIITALSRPYCVYQNQWWHSACLIIAHHAMNFYVKFHIKNLKCYFFQKLLMHTSMKWI